MDDKVAEESGENVIKHAIAFDNGNLGGEIFAELTKGETRTLTDFEIQDMWRQELPEIPGVKSFNISSPGGPGGGSDLSFEFSSSDIKALRSISDELKEALDKYEGVTDINDTFSGGSEEIQLALKPQADALGISLRDLISRFALVSMVRKYSVSRDDEEVKVMVRYPKTERSSIEHLENMRIRAPNGQEIPFEQVATFTVGQGFDSIIRVDGKRSVTVTGAVDKALLDPSEVTNDVIENLMPDLLARYPKVDFQLQGNSKEQADAMISLMQELFCTLCHLYLACYSLKSYSQPFIIMSFIPFGIVSAIVGHLVLGMAVSVLSIYGIIALSGVVVNDNLIMVDFVNRAHKEDMSLMDAAISAGTQRLEIILTSLTTFMGLMPLFLSAVYRLKL